MCRKDKKSILMQLFAQVGRSFEMAYLQQNLVSGGNVELVFKKIHYTANQPARFQSRPKTR